MSANGYEEKIWYYPYIKNDKGNRRHIEILAWLREQFSDSKEFWDIYWIQSSHVYRKYAPENLYLFFKSSEMAMAFKLRWV